MGASGAGKTTLLNVLTCRNLSKLNVTAQIYANGELVKPEHLTAISAYVQQQDLFIGTLTVREVLRFQVITKPACLP
jgi:ABC-type multidrug transport system ATPase subunit